MKEKKPYGMGYIEYLAVKQEVDELREKGYRFSLIHKKLLGEGKITMSYESFSRYASGRNRPYGYFSKPLQSREIHKSNEVHKNNQIQNSTPQQAIKQDFKQSPENPVPKKAESFSNGKQYALSELFFDED